ncbi:uncharacterized protein PHACADRAFT_203559 [Phanerochaete carnosa HHB-10118-sp]|uniref:C2H2-type domain-containing protein n=1 Tax=Phanerochaete carnosa (strain HHB-10118-sp) TaxID=650164 RepID=K5W8U5_PHACS|nr:uncharacterized protein PHACADRAFT_203559 [Phanerochaete carnosa HHB-10118-sp]EKM60333.1 hypothetical protein PHACADRAFT_203559 [Phanerochaete carnosa HHB-10118-sp]
MSSPSSVSTTFKIEDAPGTSHNAIFTHWHPGAYYYSFSATQPYGCPPGSTLAHVNPSMTSTSAFPATPGIAASTEYTATPCPDCGQVIKVSSSTTYHMDRHRESQRCMRQAVRKLMEEEEARASALRTELFSNVPCDRVQRGNGGSARAAVAGDSGKEAQEEDSGEKYCDIGIQADPVLPQLQVPQVRTTRKASRRCQSEPLLGPLESHELDAAAKVCVFVVNSDLQAQKATKERDSVKCLQCGETLLKRNVRSHVGSHILRQVVSAPEGPNMKHTVHPSNPCGFCGRAGCDINLVKTDSPASKYTATTSNCPHAHSFSWNKARRFSSVMPCTNVPVQCLLCPKDPFTKLRTVYWKYNMFHHIQTAHPEHWDWQAHRVHDIGINFRRLLAISERELDTVARGRTRPYPGAVGGAVDDGDGSVISNKRAAVEALVRSTSHDSEGSLKRFKKS